VPPKCYHLRMKWPWRRSETGGGDSLPLDGNPDEVYARGIELIDSGRKGAGIQLLTRLAATGHRQATIVISLDYLQRGDYDAAEPRLRNLAAQGDSEGMYLLGTISRARDKDEAAARRWFLGGGSWAHPRCMFELGTAAIMDEDPLTAQYWLGRAAIAGETDAMVNLAGTLVNTDPDGMHMWWQRAADLGNQVAIRNLQLSPSP
jgi:TPR repeat protein